MRSFLYFLLSFVYALVLLAITTIGSWQYWVLLVLMWCFASSIDAIINRIK